MAYIETIKKKSLDEITKETFKEAIFLCYKGGITSVAPLGFSGDNIMLFGEVGYGKPDVDFGRKSVVSIRNYSGNAELLITDAGGNFLFYGRFDINIGIGKVCTKYWNIFKFLKDEIEGELPQVSDFKKIKIPDDCTRTIGFDLLRTLQF